MEKAHFILLLKYICLWVGACGCQRHRTPKARAGGGCKLPDRMLGTELYSPARTMAGQNS